MQAHNDNVIHEFKYLIVEANITSTAEVYQLFDAVSNINSFDGLKTKYPQTRYYYKDDFRLLACSTKS